jgi:hypothetical protein
LLLGIVLTRDKLLGNSIWIAVGSENFKEKGDSGCKLFVSVAIPDMLMKEWKGSHLDDMANYLTYHADSQRTVLLYFTLGIKLEFSAMLID